MTERRTVKVDDPVGRYTRSHPAERVIAVKMTPTAARSAAAAARRAAARLDADDADYEWLDWLGHWIDTSAAQCEPGKPL